jgi:hypothetical protein
LSIIPAVAEAHGPDSLRRKDENGRLHKTLDAPARGRSLLECPLVDLTALRYLPLRFTLTSLLAVSWWFWLSIFFKESQMKFPRDPHMLLLKAGLTIILAIELYKFIIFIAS